MKDGSSPTRRRATTARSLAPRRPKWATMRSITCSPTDMRGSRAVPGSWKIMAMRRPDGGEVPLGERRQVEAAEEDAPPGDPGGDGEQPQDGVGGHGLAGAGGPHEGGGAAGGHVEPDVLQDGEVARGPDEGDSQPLDPELPAPLGVCHGVSGRRRATWRSKRR